MQTEINRNQPTLYPFSLKNAFFAINSSLTTQTHSHQKHNYSNHFQLTAYWLNGYFRKRTANIFNGLILTQQTTVTNYNWRYHI